MYPTSRYVVGLTKPQLCPDQSFGDMDCDCTYAKSIGAACEAKRGVNDSRVFPNPLYSTTIGTNNAGSPVYSPSASSSARADNSGVFLAGIVGVPWQDIGYQDVNGNVVYIPVTDPAWTGQPGTTSPITPVPATGGIWANIYGDDNANIVPQDVHMVESIEPRPGIAPGDPINGGEWNTAYQGLEYACIYTLTAPKDCACDATALNYASCKYLHRNECCDLGFNVDGRGGPGGPFDKPLCNGQSQVSAEAHPGLREIVVLHDYAIHASIPGNSVVASICPADVRVTTNKSSPGYGYNPAVTALVNQLKSRLKGGCLAQPIRVDAQTGSVLCNLVEVVNANALNGVDCTAFCTANHRSAVTAAITADASIAMQQSGICDRAGAPACSSMCQCLLEQESSTNNTTGNAAGNDLAVCQNVNDGTENALPPGYCYVDPSAGAGANPYLVAQCPDTQRRILRFVGNNPTSTVMGGVAVPLVGATVLLSCPASPQ